MNKKFINMSCLVLSCLVLTAQLVQAAPTVKNCLGTNICTGTTGSDFLKGNSKNNNINGIDGNDMLEGGNGSDKLNGGNGDDQLVGDTYSYSYGVFDYLLGGYGKDVIYGGGKNEQDLLYGGTGVDTFILNAFVEADSDSPSSILMDYNNEKITVNVYKTYPGDDPGEVWLGKVNCTPKLSNKFETTKIPGNLILPVELWGSTTINGCTFKVKCGSHYDKFFVKATAEEACTQIANKVTLTIQNR